MIKHHVDYYSTSRICFVRRILVRFFVRSFFLSNFHLSMCTCDILHTHRSDAAEGTDGVRSPINYASSYIDLDFVYGRSAEDAAVLRTLEDGLMNITDSGVPFQNEDGTWLVSVGRKAGREGRS